MQLGMAAAVIIHRGALSATASVPAERGRRVETCGGVRIDDIAHIGARTADPTHTPPAPSPGRGAVAGY